VASVSISCPSRSATDGVVRNSKSTAGHQRYLCSHCRKTWQLQFTYTASQPGTHQKIIDMAMNNRVVVISKVHTSYGNCKRRLSTVWQILIFLRG
jgi:transposase-like protein